MLWQAIVSIVTAFADTMMKILPYMIVAGVLFPLLALRYPCNPGAPWWRSKELPTNLCYWFVVPVFTRYVRIGLLVLGATWLFGIKDEQEIIDFYDKGHGPLAELPFWAQVVLYLVISDFML